MSGEKLDELLGLPSEGDDPVMYMNGDEQKLLDKWLTIPNKYTSRMNKKLMKPEYALLLKVVSQVLFGYTGSHEQISLPKLRVMAAVIDGDKVKFNWKKFILQKMIAEKNRIVTLRGKVVLGSKITYCTKASYILEKTFEKHALIKSKKFPLKKILFRILTDKSLKRKRLFDDKKSKKVTRVHPKREKTKFIDEVEEVHEEKDEQSDESGESESESEQEEEVESGEEEKDEQSDVSGASESVQEEEVESEEEEKEEAAEILTNISLPFRERSPEVEVPFESVEEAREAEPAEVVHPKTKKRNKVTKATENMKQLEEDGTVKRIRKDRKLSSSEKSKSISKSPPPSPTSREPSEKTNSPQNDRDRTNLDILTDIVVALKNITSPPMTCPCQKC